GARRYANFPGPNETVVSLPSLASRYAAWPMRSSVRAGPQMRGWASSLFRSRMLSDGTYLDATAFGTATWGDDRAPMTRCRPFVALPCSGTCRREVGGRCWRPGPTG